MEEDLYHLAGDFFTTFARFEYALKATGFHNGDGAAEPNWRLFAESIADAFDHPSNQEFIEAIDYILKAPPKKQKIDQGNVTWETATPNTDLRADLVLLYVRRVRNNLFHGGKFNGHWFEPKRSEELLQHSLIILHGCLVASKKVRDAFNA